ncbi:hypothetical protein DDB_G0268216 [Dictyostelium discoideum AX4]|uniref:Fanconi anemia group D2 protein homolog n=1 Tax=Dictyostelium discoideum TaxID=44689 RepID=Q55F81_DICDI|nr:hypothetical protein DDB_G0268216 [Dictyostelium discoideum AX4]EAL73561.1 hypothetical protein DDB_G0268216 [Dictyostelium discoideum AX4]|eukprot:XP_647652.1 hypothetical protein DDB_G0268216 [Dictyostelium discoideum AX4]
MDRRFLEYEDMNDDDLKDDDDDESLNNNNNNNIIDQNSKKQRLYDTPCSFTSNIDDNDDDLSDFNTKDNQQQQQQRQRQQQQPINSKRKQEFQKLLDETMSKTKEFKVVLGKHMSIQDPIIVSDIVTFKRSLETYFNNQSSSNNALHSPRDNNSSESKLQSFKDGFALFIENESILELALSPVRSESSNDFIQKYGNNFSETCLIRLLLSTPIVQPLILDVLFDSMYTFAAEDTNGFCKKIFSQLRWLDTISDGPQLLAQIGTLLGLLDVNPELKKDIIRFLPDIVDNECHSEFIDILMGIYKENEEFVLPILDALANLNLNSAHLTNVRETVGESLRESDFNILPMRITFLLSTSSSKENSAITSKAIRERLDLKKPILINGSTTEILNDPNNKETDRDRKPTENLILEALKSGIRFKKDLCDAFIKEIEEARTHNILDFWLIVLIHSFGHKSTEKIFKKLVKSGLLSKKLLIESIYTHEFALQQYFTTMLTLCDFCIRSIETKVREFGESFYELLFKCYRDEGQQRELISMLLAHIISGNNSEVNCGLEVLYKLCSPLCSDMLIKFSHEIKRVLDYIDTLTESQIRTLFRIFGTLLYTDRISSNSYKLEPNGRIFTELDIFTRKQITSTKIKYKKIGIISMCSQISRISRVIINHNNELQLPRELFEEYEKLFQSLLLNCDKSRLARSYLFDELANVYMISPFHQSVTNSIGEYAQRYFQNDFIELVNQYDKSMIWGSMGNTFGDEGICIYPNLSEGTTTRDDNKLLCLSSAFRLIRILQPKDQSLEEIDVMLTHPFIMFNKEIVSINNSHNFKDDKEKELYCLSLYYSTNYIRELLNAFTTLLIPLRKNQQNQHQQHHTQSLLSNNEKLLNRLNILISMEDKFEMVLSHSNSFVIPHGTFESDQRKPFSIELKKNKKLPTSASTTATTTTLANSNSINQLIKYNIDLKDFVTPGESLIEIEKPYLKLIKPYYRSLDLSCFHLFKPQTNNTTTTTTSKSNQNNLEPNGMLYLLEEFYNKLDTVSTPDRTSHLHNEKIQLPFSYEQFILQTGVVFRYLLEHLKNLSNQFKQNRLKLLQLIKSTDVIVQQKNELQIELEEEYDASKDNEVKKLKKEIEKRCDQIQWSNNNQTITQHCIQLILQIFEKLFHTGGSISKTENDHKLFLDLLNSISTKANQLLGENIDQQQQQQPVGGGGDRNQQKLKIFNSIFTFFKSFIQIFVSSKSFKASFTLLQVLISLYSSRYIGNKNIEEMKFQIHNYSRILLAINWISSGKQKVSSQSLGVLLKAYFDHTSNEDESIKTSINYLKKYFGNESSKKNVLTTNSSSSQSSKNKRNNNNSSDSDEENDNDEKDDLINREAGGGGDDDDDDNKFINIVETGEGIEFKISSLNSTTLLPFLKSIYSALINNLKSSIEDKNLQTDQETACFFKRSSFFISMYASLVETAKERDKSLYLIETLKQAVSFVTVFIKLYIPVFKSLVKKKSLQIIGRVIKEIENLRLHNGILNNICSHGKETSDSSIIAMEPQVKKTLESLNMEVKGILAGVNASEAFGTKKVDKRKLNGDEFFSSDDDDGDDDSDQSSDYSDSDDNKKRKTKKKVNKKSTKKSTKKIKSNHSDEEEEEEEEEKKGVSSSKQKKQTKKVGSLSKGSKLRKMGSDDDDDDEKEVESESSPNVSDNEDYSRSVSRGRSRSRSISHRRRSTSRSLSISDRSRSRSVEEAEVGEPESNEELSSSEPDEGDSLGSQSDRSEDEEIESD